MAYNQNKMTTQTNTEEEKLTFTLWNYKQYKESVEYNNNFNKENHKIKVSNIKREIEKLKNQLKEIEEDKPIKKIPTKKEFIEELDRQRSDALRLNCIVIENKDSEGLK